MQKVILQISDKECHAFTNHSTFYLVASSSKPVFQSTAVLELLNYERTEKVWDHVNKVGASKA
jgi:predicted ATP-binding protein involved in virulence